jgi:hypothetical protein
VKEGKREKLHRSHKSLESHSLLLPQRNEHTSPLPPPFEDEDDDEDEDDLRRRHAATPLPTRQRLKDKTFQIFGLGKMRQNRMIERLRQRFEPAQMSFGIDAGIDDDVQ